MQTSPARVVLRHGHRYAIRRAVRYEAALARHGRRCGFISAGIPLAIALDPGPVGRRAVLGRAAATWSVATGLGSDCSFNIAGPATNARRPPSLSHLVVYRLRLLAGDIILVDAAASGDRDRLARLVLLSSVLLAGVCRAVACGDAAAGHFGSCGGAGDLGRLGTGPRPCDDRLFDGHASPYPIPRPADDPNQRSRRRLCRELRASDGRGLCGSHVALGRSSRSALAGAAAGSRSHCHLVLRVVASGTR